MKTIIFILAIATIVFVHRKIQRHFAEVESSLFQQTKIKDSSTKTTNHDLSSTI